MLACFASSPHANIYTGITKLTSINTLILKLDMHTQHNTHLCTSFLRVGKVIVAPISVDFDVLQSGRVLLL